LFAAVFDSWTLTGVLFLAFVCSYPLVKPKKEHNGGQFLFELHKITPKTEQQNAQFSPWSPQIPSDGFFYNVCSVLDLWMHNGSMLRVRLSAWPWPNGVLGGRPLTVLGVSTMMEQSRFCFCSIYAECTRKSSSLHFTVAQGCSLARPLPRSPHHSACRRWSSQHSQQERQSFSKV
jgi:hypothetical protein